MVSYITGTALTALIVDILSTDASLEIDFVERGWGSRDVVIVEGMFIFFDEGFGPAKSVYLRRLKSGANYHLGVAFGGGWGPAASLGAS